MLRHYTLTLSGSAQRLSSLVAAVDSQFDDQLGVCWLQPDGGNGNPIYVGGSDAITSSSYGFRLEAAASTIPPAPFSFGELEPGRNLKLSELYVLGTSDEKLHVAVIPRK